MTGSVYHEGALNQDGGIPADGKLPPICCGNWGIHQIFIDSIVSYFSQQVAIL